MTLDDLRRIVRNLKGPAADKLRVYGHVLDVDDQQIEAVVAALGEISFDEALDLLVRAAFEARGERLHGRPAIHVADVVDFDTLVENQILQIVEAATAPAQVPTIGRIVRYRLSADDAEAINRRRTTGADIAARLKSAVGGSADGYHPPVYAWPAGAQAHIGPAVTEGDVLPLIITRVVETSAVNGQVFLDGTDVYWVTLRTLGDRPGTYHWPPR